MRAIDVDALIEFIENRYNITWKDDYEGGIKDACTDILEKINKMPTIEPERKKGKWIEDNCSECGCYVYHGDVRNFCPNCGAKMNGGNQNE